MDTNQPYTELFKPGDHLILQLGDETIFEGDFADAAENRIDLLNVTQHNNPNANLGGVYTFYRNEISKFLYHKAKVIEMAAVKTTVDCDNKISILKADYDRLKQMFKDFVYIDKADNRYYDAMKKLIAAETIGVAALGMEPSRNARIRLLAISTWREVFLLDLAEHKNRYFYPELKEIFESEYVCKVMHKGSPLVDILYRNYKVYMENTFDTQVVDMIIEKAKMKECPKKGKTLSECLVCYFNMPISILRDAAKISDSQWMERPLSKEMKLYASQLVTYLVILKEKMQKIMLGKVYQTINNVHELYYNFDDYNFSQSCKNDEIKRIEEIIPTLNKETIDEAV